MRPEALRGASVNPAPLASFGHDDGSHLLVLAVAEPYTERSGFALSAGGHTHRVLVLDGSYSMAYKPTDKSRFERAKELAARIVGETPIYDITVGTGEGDIRLGKLQPMAEQGPFPFFDRHTYPLHPFTMDDSVRIVPSRSMTCRCPGFGASPPKTRKASEPT